MSNRGLSIVGIVLGTPALVSTALGVIGFPLLYLPSRAGAAESERNAHTFHQAMEAWEQHDGWRLSAASWIYFAIALGLLGLYRKFQQEENGKIGTVWKQSLRFALPAVMVFAAGVTLQISLGLGQDNYSNDAALPTRLLALPAAAIAIWLAITGVAAVRARQSRKRVRHVGRTGRHS
ncbi:hypothetical protein [Curtobacterium sp. MCBD17_040]|uniref:hypothetical protein n=1 Tax=Curtobacterium sp. MCBD17_040 TaxID=2175674 RepID=UPI0011B62F28|nr:hypothetical protein [Curtobacterium sp. MCBD17_040]WIB63747.1 hypothetical protein DEI94_00745 [Curtobacterium sp. MCBD17_040]